MVERGSSSEHFPFLSGFGQRVLCADDVTRRELTSSSPRTEAIQRKRRVKAACLNRGDGVRTGAVSANVLGETRRTRKSIGGETPAVIIDVPRWPVPAACVWGSLRNAKLAGGSKNADALARASDFPSEFIASCSNNSLCCRGRLRLIFCNV